MYRSWFLLWPAFFWLHITENPDFSIIFNNKKISEKYLLLSVISCY